MNTHRASGQLDAGETFQPMSACLCEEFGPYGMHGKMDTKNGGFTLAPHPDLLLDDAEVSSLLNPCPCHKA